MQSSQIAGRQEGRAGSAGDPAAVVERPRHADRQGDLQREFNNYEPQNSQTRLRDSVYWLTLATGRKQTTSC